MDKGDELNAIAEEKRQLQAEIERSGEVLEQYRQELREIEDRIDALTADAPRFEALARLCASLEELEDAGAAHLFWGEDAPGNATAERLAHARESIGRFESDLAALQDTRAQINDKIGVQDAVVGQLDYDLARAIEEEEARKSEWLIERKVSKLPFRQQIMPWARGCEEDERFLRTLAASVVVCLLGGLVFSLVDLPIPERERLIEVPERVAMLVQEKRRAPEPEVVQPAEPEPVEPEPEPEPEPVLADEPVPELSEQPAQKVAEVQPESTKEQVRSKGILAFRESFANSVNERPAARLGAQARVNSAGAEAVGRPSRAMVTTNAPGSSGGINLADISRDVGGGGGGGLQGVQVTQVASSISGSGSADRPMSGGPSAGRTDEEIQIVFDRYKAALYRLYNRELRKDPTLRGQLVLKLTIEPDGSVSFCTLQASDMDAPALAQQIVERVSGFDFGAKEDILSMTIIYPIDFLPAA